MFKSVLHASLGLALSCPVAAETIITTKPEALKCGKRHAMEGIDYCELKFSVTAVTDNKDKNIEQVFGSCQTGLKLYMPPTYGGRSMETKSEDRFHYFNVFARNGEGTGTLWETFQVKAPSMNGPVIGAAITSLKCWPQ